MKKSLILAGALVLGVAGAAHAFYYENSTPHNATAKPSGIVCDDCHGAPVWGDPNGSKPYLLNKVNSATGDTDCKVCHVNATGRNYTAKNAPFVKTHSSQNLGEKYGRWGFNCWDCHRNHGPDPVTTALVTGEITGVTQGIQNDTTFTIQNVAVFDESGNPNPCTDLVNNGAWCTPADWMAKTHAQTPYDPAADPSAPEYVGGPCDPGPDGIPGTADDNYDPNYECTPGVYPGERGLLLWVTYDSGNKGSFEITYASDTQITVQGQIPSGETLTTPVQFELRYGMLITDQPSAFGFCSPDPQFNYCYDAVNNVYTSTCTTDADCNTGETCTPRAVPTQCRSDADCPTGATCVQESIGALGPFNGPQSQAYDESGTGTDPTPIGTCQVCHTKTSHWRNDGTGADHNNGRICTSCHKHTTGFQPSGCTACHTLPPQDPLPSYGTDGPTGATTAGAHNRHAKEYNYPCTTCHTGGMPDSSIYDYKLQIGFNTPDGQGGAGTVFYGENSLADATTPWTYVGMNGTQVIPTDPTDPNYLTCQNVYCHSQGKRILTGIQSGDLPSSSPPWNKTWADWDPQNDGDKCNNCHNYPPTFDAHYYHYSRGFSDCALCHADTAVAGQKMIADKRKHVNGVYDVVPGSTFYYRKQPHNLYFEYTFAPDGGTCSSNTCHQYIVFEDPKQWRNRPQIITGARLNVTQGVCTGGTPTAPLASSTISVDVTVPCPDCVAPYSCDFDWGDGSPVETNVPCNTTHTYTDRIPSNYDAASNSYKPDPTGNVIGGFDITWTVRDAMNVPLDVGTITQRVDVCGLPNQDPTPAFRIDPGPDAAAYDVILTDLSVDPDAALGTHWDWQSNGATVVPGAIYIDWGYGPAMESPITLNDTPSNVQFQMTYPAAGYYWIWHGVKDNDGESEYIWSPATRIFVDKTQAYIR